MDARRFARRLIRLKKLADNPHCLYCGVRLWANNSTLDHIIPLNKGGQDDEPNLALCCSTCNACKGRRSLSEWVADLAKALSSTIPAVRPVHACRKPAT